MRPGDFHYELPAELIAQEPLAERSASRLLLLDGASGRVEDRRFRELAELLDPGDLLVFNDTRVIPARLIGRKATGGRVEILLERPTGARTAVVQLGARRKPAAGSRLELPGDASAIVTRREGAFFVLELDRELLPYLEQHGLVPLPPYIARAAEQADRERYQTLFAREPGAVAAPTAGLHFDRALLAALASRGVDQAFVTLHVGAGTFSPLRDLQVSSAQLHAERVSVSQQLCASVNETRRRGGRVVAVGTTVVRALETAAGTGALKPLAGETRLFIQPGYRFRVIDAIVTNFHLPESSLLMLVAAFAGREQTLAAYHHAVAAGYRFFSYGDAMLVLPERARMTGR